MKSKAAIGWFIVSVALGACLAWQWKSAQRQQTILEKVQMQVEQGTAKEQQANARVKELEKQVRNLTGELRSAEYELNKAKVPQTAAASANNGIVPQQANPASADKGAQNGGMGKMLASMMKDPEMRKAMEAQQRMGLEMMYGSLFKQLKLPPDQEKALRDLLLSQQMDNMEQAGAMFDGEGNRTQAAKELAAKSAEKQEKLKELLGDEKYAQYQDYNQTISERMMLDQLGKQADISPEQNEQLLAIIKEEKKNMQINRGTPPFDPTRDLERLMQPGSATEQMFSQQEEVNNRVLERAGQVLTPEQLQKFAPLMKSQLEMQKVGLKMAREMFKSGDQPAVPTP